MLFPTPEEIYIGRASQAREAGDAQIKEDGTGEVDSPRGRPEPRPNIDAS